MNTENPNARPPRNPTQDVVRGIAITLVVLYHLPNQPIGAGLIGVDLFMVISGYLVTKNLISNSLEWQDVRDFWRRRARRVVAPAIALVLVVLFVRGFTWRLSPRDDFWDGAAAVGFAANWRFISSGTDYFRSASGFSPFQHLWSLSVEEQFYFIWPLIVFFAKKKLRMIVLTLIPMSFLLMAYFAHSGNISRAYFGTDSRSGTLLIGALLAIGLGQLESLRSILRGKRFEVLVALFVVVAFVVSGNSTYMYTGGFLVVALIAAGIVISASELPLDKNSIFGSRSLYSVLHFIGIRSFSIYLVHWPIFVIFSSRRVFVDEGVEIAFQMLVTGICAEAMYRAMEVSWTRKYAFNNHITVKLMSSSLLLVVALIFSGLYSSSAPSFLNGGTDTKLTQSNDKKVLLIGDSIVQSLVDLGITKRTEGFTLDYIAISGCGLLPGVVVDSDRKVYEPSRECERRVDDNLWSKVSPDSYDVVVWLDAWDAEDRLVAGSVLSQITNPQEFQDLYGEVIKRLNKVGKRVAVVTLPAKAQSSLTNKEAPPENILRRYKASDQSLKKSAQRTKALIIDLNNFVCRAISPCKDLSPQGQRFRPIDGIHFSGPGGSEATHWLRAQMADLLTN